MLDPNLFDMIELLVDLPDHGLRVGEQGTIVHKHSETDFEIEFSDADGQTVALVSLPLPTFVVVWQAENNQWVRVEEQVKQIVARLPEEAQTEVLDFARFLTTRKRLPSHSAPLVG